MHKISWLLLLFCFLQMGCGPKAPDKLRIATAANMQFAMQELHRAFEATTGIDCEIILGSSGKLTAQIKEGAPFDVLVSADMKFPMDLYKNGLAAAEPQIYAYGKLVLWSMDQEIKSVPEALTNSAIDHIALANPKTAPYGEASMQVLRHHQLYDELRGKLVYGESISQTNQFITSGAAALGFTAKSVILSPEIKGKGHWLELDTDQYRAIAQGVLQLQNRPNLQPKAQKFVAFLFSEKAQAILTQFGYQVVEK